MIMAKEDDFVIVIPVKAQSSFSQAIYARGVFLLGDKKFSLLSKVPGDTQNKVLLLPPHKHTVCISFVFNTFFSVDDRKKMFMKRFSTLLNHHRDGDGFIYIPPVRGTLSTIYHRYPIE